MSSHRALFAVLLLALVAAASASAQDKTKGSLKGKVRDEREALVSGVTVTAQQGEREVAYTTTNRKGEFLLEGLAPGRYALTFRKPGLSTGTVQNVEVRAGKTSSLPDRLILRVDEGSIAFL